MSHIEISPIGFKKDHREFCVDIFSNFYEKVIIGYGQNLKAPHIQSVIHSYVSLLPELFNIYRNKDNCQTYSSFLRRNMLNLLALPSTKISERIIEIFIPKYIAIGKLAEENLFKDLDVEVQLNFYWLFSAQFKRDSSVRNNSKMLFDYFLS